MPTDLTTEQLAELVKDSGSKHSLFYENCDESRCLVNPGYCPRALRDVISHLLHEREADRRMLRNVVILATYDNDDDRIIRGVSGILAGLSPEQDVEDGAQADTIIAAARKRIAEEKADG